VSTDDWPHILITGSRSFTDRTFVCETLASTLYYRWPLVIMHGACASGPDVFAAQWADSYPDTEVIAVARPVTSQDWTVYGAAAGPRRNQGMVDEIARVMQRGIFTRCMAFIGPCISLYCRRPKPHDSHGASGCADMAEAAGIWTTRHRMQTQET
jgi:hypothetical protein